MLAENVRRLFLNVFEAFTKAFRTIDNDHAYIHEGIMFVAFDKAVVASDGMAEYAFITPSTGFVHYRLAGISPSADKVDTQIFRDAVYTDATGTELESNNKNDNSNTLAGVTILKNPTFTADGDLLPGFSSYLPGSTGVGQTRIGASGKADDEIVLRQSTVYRFVATNGSTAENTIGINLRWYEEAEG